MSVTANIDRFSTISSPILLAERLASDKFASRAADYDERAQFPQEDFDDLFQAGLNRMAIPVEYGGMGYGPYQNDVLTLWMVTRALAKVNLSLARCWEGHMNALILLNGMANHEQKQRWYEGVQQRGHKWACWSGEPQLKTPGQKNAIGTCLEPVDGGYLLTGTKAFCTSAGHADYAILLVNSAGPGGARHADVAAQSTVLALVCDLSDATISFDDSWWHPIGMRATVSHLVRFKRTFIPADHLIGQPGAYLSDGWQACFTPHYAASFLGAAEGANDYARQYISGQQRAQDPYVQQHIGQMALNIESGHLWLRKIAELWNQQLFEQAKLAGLRARYVVQQLAADTLQRCISACGARCLNRPSPVERIYRDLNFYFQHDNADHILATIGRSELEQNFDGSFFNMTADK